MSEVLNSQVLELKFPPGEINDRLLYKMKSRTLVEKLDGKYEEIHGNFGGDIHPIRLLDGLYSREVNGKKIPVYVFKRD